MNTINLNRLTTGAAGLCLGDATTGYLNIIPGAANTGAGILMEIAARHLTALPVPCWWVSTTDGSVLQHVAASSPPVATDWTLSGSLVGLTATVAELNALHGSGVTEADLAKLHAITLTAAQINAL